MSADEPLPPPLRWEQTRLHPKTKRKILVARDEHGFTIARLHRTKGGSYVRSPHTTHSTTLGSLETAQAIVWQEYVKDWRQKQVDRAAASLAAVGGLYRGSNATLTYFIDADHGDDTAASVATHTTGVPSTPYKTISAAMKDIPNGQGRKIVIRGVRR